MDGTGCTGQVDGSPSDENDVIFILNNTGKASVYKFKVGNL